MNAPTHLPIERASHLRARPSTILLAAFLLVAWMPQALAQTYPERPIRLVVPSPPGGGTDTLSRVVAAKLGDTLRWHIVVDNRPGAGGNLGLDVAAKSAADGYTIVMGESSNLTINPALYASLPFDPEKDLAPIALVGTVPLVLVTAPGRQLDSMPAVLKTAQAGRLTFASSGNGTVGHLVGELWKRSAGIELLHVPYKGAGPAVTDLMAGQVDLHFASLPAAAPLIRSGKLTALAVSSAQRAAQLPDVPTLAELGYPGFDAKVVYGVLAPARTLPAIVERLNAEINRALQAPDVQATLARSGVDVRPGTPGEFATFLSSERSKWARVVKESGAKVD